ncbi:putative multi-domain containing protein [Aduncisulcus paluster]|nr:putative multi-domain containing protein [Aduncisulcus paluster]
MDVKWDAVLKILKQPPPPIVEEDPLYAFNETLSDVFAAGMPEKKRDVSQKSSKPPGIIIAGAPGCGKGTQAKHIVSVLGVVHISSGDVLRDHVRRKTALGEKAKRYMEKGEYVPDDLIVELIRHRLAEDDCKKNGWLLDGFPRTEIQADALSKANIEVDQVFYIDVSDAAVMERTVTRRLDPITGEIYSLSYPPCAPPDDPVIRDRLVHREDDKEKAVKERLHVFHSTMDGVLDHYRGKVIKINGEQASAGVWEDIFHHL